MKSDLETNSTTSPPSKKLRTADFSSIIKRSHSMTEEALEIEMSSAYKKKIVNDSIHGHIELPAVAVAIVDTPQFQRLRYLKQTGVCHFVYPNATHTRFQHSIGVGHLAFKFAEKLRKENPHLVDEKDSVCVMIAGLCHDLGHGPFSHLWEGFVHEVHPNSDWHHEDNSVKMLDYLIEDNNLKPILKSLGNIDAQDILFIKEAIAGPIDETTGLPMRNIPTNDNVWRYRGRTEAKSFLYEIVANKISGLDVDKWDYLIRDASYFNIGRIFDPDRIMNYAKVIKTGENERKHICIRDKEAEGIMEMFIDRARMHKNGYQHRVTKLIDAMMLDIFFNADQHIQIKGRNGKKYSMSEACEDIVAHEKLTDEIFLRIKDADSEDPEMKTAQNLIQRIMKRDFYKSLATINITKDHPFQNKNPKDLEVELQNLIQKEAKHLKPQELIVIQSKVSMGMGTRNPIHNVTFYNKEGDVVEDVNALNISQYLPDFLNFKTFNIVCKSTDKSALKEAVTLIQKVMPKIEKEKNGHH